MTVPPLLFDRALRRVRRDRAARSASADLETLIADDLLDRLGSVQRTFTTALVINTGKGALASRLRANGLNVRETDHGPAFAQAAQAVFCDEDRLPPDLGQFDLVLAPAGFDTIDDLPGALIAARLSLKRGGLFLGCMIGAPSLSVLRNCATMADATSNIAVARLHPQVDVRAAGDLLVRAGFVLPVADSLPLNISYPSLDRLISDLRTFGGSNVMANRHPASRQWLYRLAQAFRDAAAPDGRTAETVTLVTMTGWSPDP